MSPEDVGEVESFFVMLTKFLAALKDFVLALLGLD
jgi:hypothetical protein